MTVSRRDTNLSLPNHLLRHHNTPLAYCGRSTILQLIPLASQPTLLRANSDPPPLLFLRTIHHRCPAHTISVPFIFYEGQRRLHYNNPLTTSSAAVQELNSSTNESPLLKTIPRYLFPWRLTPPPPLIPHPLPLLRPLYT